MSDITVESLQIEVQAPSDEAAKSINELTATLGKLKSATKCLGLNAVSKQLTTLNKSLDGISGNNTENLRKLAQSLQTISTCGNLKLSSSIATQIANIGTAAKSLKSIDFTALRNLPNVLAPLNNLGKANLNSFISQLQRLPQAVQSLNSVDMGSLSGNISQLISVLSPLSSMGKNNLTSFVTQLNKLPKLMENLKAVDMRTLYNQIQSLTRVFKPLADEMQKISNGFSAFPMRIQRLITSTERLTTSNNSAAKSYINLWAKCRMAYVSVTNIARVVGSWINASNQHIENLNLFTVAMGKYADEAKNYAKQVSEVMGINISDWFRSQGIFMTLATGLGVASESASLMSKNLTQLGYDISSFFNISVEDAMQKLKSAMSGELEPVRNLGYALSQNSLQELAVEHGITKKISAMTEAEKVELRYIALMKQNTIVQGDMARTLDSPTNALRRLKSSLEMAAISIGNLFLPVLQAILPVAIAVANVIRLIADSIANLLGFNIQDFDFTGETGIGSVTDSAENVENALGNAADKAKELKNALLGIDELNVISPTDTTGGTSSDITGGGGLGLELPTYNFMKDIKTEVDDIVQKMKEWLGLTEEINSWSDFFHTRLGRILTTVGAITLGLAAWKISKGLLDVLSVISKFKKAGLDKPFKITAGISLAITGITLETAGIIDAIKNELNGMNFSQIIGGGGLIATGGATIGSAFGKALLGGGVGAIIAGIPAFITGIYDSLKNGIDWLSAALTAVGSTAAGFGIGAICAAAGTAITPGIGTLIGLAVGLVVDGIILVVQKWDVITDFLSNFFTVTVPNLWGRFTSWLSNIPKQLGTFFKALPGKIADWFDKLWQPIRDYDWKNLGYNIGQWFGNAWKSAVNFVTVTIPTWFTKMWDSIKNAFKQFFTVTLPTFFTQTLPSVAGKIGEFFKQLPKKMYDAFVSAKNWFVDIGGAIIDGIWEGLQSIWKAITDFVDGFVQGFKDALGIHSPSTVFAEIGKNIVDGLLQGIQGFTDMLSTVSEWASSVVEWFVRGEDGLGIVEHFKQIGGNIITGFKDKIGNTYTTAKTNITTWANNVKEWFTNSSFGGVNRENFSVFANNIIDGFRNKVSTAYTNVKNSITTWANNVKNWFLNSSFGGVNGSAFMSYASNIVDGFKNRVSSYYTAAQNAMTTFGSNVKSWFTSNVSYSKFYDTASDVIDGFKNGIGNLYQTCKNTISSWGSSIINWFKDKLNSNSPSKVFERIGKDTILGYNIGITSLGKTTKGVVNKWADSFTSVSPVMSFAVDTTALRYYSSDSFAKSVSANVTSNSSITATGFVEGMKEFYKEYVEPTLTRIADDTKRQADKQEQTVVQVGNRTVTDAVTTQQKANGFRFATV